MNLLNGLPLMSEEAQSWIQSLAGERVSDETLRALQLPWQNRNQKLESDGTSYTCSELPNRLLVEQYASKYCSSFECLVFPVVKAQVPRILHESTAEGLQALVILIQYHYFIGDLPSAEALVAAASRLVYALEAHIQPGPPVYRKSIPECHLRDLFWLCYSFDRDMALRTGHPPTINDEHCDLTLPMGYEERQNSNILSDDIEINESTLPLYPWDPRLSRIKYSTYNGLYSVRARRKSQPEILEYIRALDEALEQWRQSLHPDFRPTLSFSPETPINARINTQAVMLRLAYYHCVAMIHRAVVHCRELPESPHSRSGRVESSISLCVDASRSTLTYLRKALPVVEDECFWVVLFYPITAIMVMFSSVLEDPLNSSITHDLDILGEVPALIRQTPIREFTIAEMIHLESLADLTAELAKLGRLAQDKACSSMESLN
ncbi:fungal specific transcription factor domain-containing protein [Aspergillus affinis]|uniref:fungal specific transcription factor domain-containing protein n=1 Tax=Aspergillus affinis TaxID=1070780 RepID=UPI0022FEB365|nr:uncharacterized protein KD926_008991 [Aspergillus affinis]KAI9039890.1 hypothetical protein KD926_008991 [Aspergillus affinis]